MLDAKRSTAPWWGDASPSGGQQFPGRVVVRFPNNDMIYLHDTPARGLFQREQGAELRLCAG